jgi:hypothetical protein
MKSILWEVNSFSLVCVSISMVAILTGCTAAFHKDDLYISGPAPIVDKGSFQQIDLALLLAPETTTAQTGNENEIDMSATLSPEQVYAQNKRLAGAIELFYQNPVALIARRNRVQEHILAASNQRCGEYKSFLKQIDAGTNFFLGSLTTIFGGAGAIFTPQNTIRALSGAAAMTSGIRSEYNEDYFASQTIQVLTNGFEEKRKELYKDMLARRSTDMTNYPVEAAIKDSIEYHASCSLISGLEYAALSIGRVNDPGLKTMQNALVKAKIMQRIMDTKPENIGNLDLAGPLRLSSPFNALAGGEGTLNHELPQVVYAKKQKQIKLFNNQFDKLIIKLKAEDFKDKKAELDGLAKLVDNFTQQSGRVLASQSENKADKATSVIQKAHAKVIETVERIEIHSNQLKLSLVVLEKQPVIIEIKIFFTKQSGNYSDTVAALNNTADDVAVRLEKATKHINGVIAGLLQTLATNGDGKLGSLTSTQETALVASVQKVDNTITDIAKLKTLLTTGIKGKLSGFVAKSSTLQAGVIKDVTGIIDALYSGF